MVNREDVGDILQILLTSGKKKLKTYQLVYFVFQVLVVIQQLFKLAEFLPTSICIAFLESCQKKPRVAIIHAEPITVQVCISHFIAKTSVLYFLFASPYDCNLSERLKCNSKAAKGLAVSIACSYLHIRTTSNTLQEVMHRDYQGENYNSGWSQTGTYQAGHR